MRGNEVGARFEELADRLTSSLGGIAPEELDGQIQSAQREICACLDLDLALLWQRAFGIPGTYGVTHAYLAAADTSLPEPMWMHAQFPWCAAELSAGKVLVLPSDALPPEGARDLDTFRRLGFRSTLGLPLSVGGGPVESALTFHDRRADRPWPASEVRQLERIGQAIAGAQARKQRLELAERASESETRLAAAVNVAGLGFYELRDGFTLTHFDERLRLLLGIPRGKEACAPAFWQEHVHPGDGPRVSRSMQEAMEGRRESVATEYRYRHPRRGIVWLHHLFRVLERDAEGKAVKAIGAIQDVTARRRALAALAQSERSFRATFEQAPVCLAHVALDGRFLWVNATFCEYLGYTREEMQQRNLLDITHQLEVPSDAGQTRKILAGEIDTVSTDRRYVRQSGEVVWGHVTLSLVRDGRGNPDWFVVIVQDITARKNAEEELSRLHGQLWHADRAAQVGVLSASLAHELNQPLSAILTNAQAGLRFLAMENPDLEEIRTILQDIVHDDKRAGMVISGLRAMLRRRATLRERIPLIEPVKEVLGLLRTEMLDRRVRVALKTDASLVVIADRTQVQQVILNLLMNAVDAMRDEPDERRRVEVTLARAEREMALVEVRDHGSGIPADQQARMFEAFWTSKESGMGIGLAISRSIVESHGGQLWYVNNPEGGATFSFTLPLREPG